MALQAAHSAFTGMGISRGKAVAPAFAGLNSCWNDRHEQRLLEWDEWFGLSTVTIMAKQSMSFTELTRTDRTQRMPATMGSLAEEVSS